MEIKISKLEQLIAKLTMAEEIYEQASKKVHDQPMSEYFSTLARKKRNFIDTLSSEMHLNGQEEKIGFEINSIVVRLKQYELLDFCGKREEELISMYQNLLNEYFDEEYKQKMILTQMVDSKDVLIKLNDKKAALQYQSR